MKIKCWRCGKLFEENRDSCPYCGAPVYDGDGAEEDEENIIEGEYRDVTPNRHSRDSYDTGRRDYREDPYRRDPYREDPYREDPYREDPYRRDPYRRDPYFYRDERRKGHGGLIAIIVILILIILFLLWRLGVFSPDPLLRNDAPSIEAGTTDNSGTEETDNTGTDTSERSDTSDSSETDTTAEIDADVSYSFWGRHVATDGQIFTDSNTRYLSQDEVDRLDVWSAEDAINEIYARKGAIFEIYPQLNDYYKKTSWYKGTTQRSNVVLDEVENSNVDLLLKKVGTVSDEEFKNRLTQLESSGNSSSSKGSTENSQTSNTSETDAAVNYSFWGQHAATDGQIFTDSSTRYLSQDDVDQLDVWSAQDAINEIYARKGAIFEIYPQLNDYYKKTSWYKGTTQRSNVTLNEVEKANVALLLKKVGTISDEQFQKRLEEVQHS